eukprot:15305802-Ditylum_brightwellii.AAC.1
MPMAPPGTKCYIHIKPYKHTSWGFHAEDAWYVKPALQRYKCYTVVMKEKSSTTNNRYHQVQAPQSKSTNCNSDRKGS